MLVDAEIEDRRVFEEDVLRAVAVVDVPVDDENLPHTVPRLEVPGRDGRIVEEAEPHPHVPSRVVPRRPDGAEGAVGRSFRHRLRPRDRPPRRQERDVEGVPVEVGVLRVEGEVAAPAGEFQLLQIFPVVDGKDIRVFRILRRHRDHPFDQADSPEMIGDGDEALRRLRVFERRGVEEVVGVVDPGHSLHERSIHTPTLYQLPATGTS
ncbi:MAG TPA: hypothetical protein VF325_07300 [Candidatus Deferrimicrobium sp.]